MHDLPHIDAGGSPAQARKTPGSAATASNQIVRSCGGRWLPKVGSRQRALTGSFALEAGNFPALAKNDTDQGKHAEHGSTAKKASSTMTSGACQSCPGNNAGCQVSVFWMANTTRKEKMMSRMAQVSAVMTFNKKGAVKFTAPNLPHCAKSGVRSTDRPVRAVPCRP
jgi:hypothetical protein